MTVSRAVLLATLLAAASSSARGPAPDAPVPAAVPSGAVPPAAASDQPVLILQSAGESPEEITARVQFERAVRAEAEGRPAEAEQAARAVLAAGQSGRFADAARAMLARLKERRGTAPDRMETSGAVSHRVELVTTATLIGLYSGALAAGSMSGPSSQAVAGLLMLGTGAGIGLSLALSSGRVVPGSFAPMMSLGSGYGTWAALALIKVTNSRPDNYAQPVLGCELVGAGLSLAVANGLAMTGGDAGASSTGAIFGGLVPFLVVGMGANGSSNIDPLIATALVGSTLGMVAAPIINQRLGWSRSRWNLIALGGGVGLLFGGGLAVLVSVNSAAGGFGLAALGTVGGLLLAGYLTDEFSPDEPRRGGSTALLESSPGEGLRFGSLAGAIAPAFTQRGGALLTGLQLRAFEARF